MNIAIDFSRRMSGGGIAHAKGLLNHAKPEKHGIEKVYVFSSTKFLSILPDKPWLYKINHPWLNKSLLWQILWQVFLLPSAMRKFQCDAVLYPDAGAFVNTKPCMVMSRDMLSFEESEIDRYPKSTYMWLRLFILRYLQIWSLNRATLPVFLTKYAADKIKEWGGPLNYQIINHGINDDFKNFSGEKVSWPISSAETIKCVYVSNLALYKHQWNVLEAINILRNKGYNIEVNFYGGGRGVALDRFKKTQKTIDPEQKYHKLFPFTNNSDLPEIISKHHLFIFASSCENMPNTLLEGMALGMPILSSNRGPMPEVLEDGGVYFDPEDINSIVNALLDIINDDQKRAKLSQRASDLSQKYSWSKCSDETFKALSIIAKKYNAR